MLNKIPKKYLTYFQKCEYDKMSFFDIKQELVTIIKKKSWYQKNNFTLIDFPNDLRQLLGLEKDGYIRFSDIDKIVYLFYFVPIFFLSFNFYIIIVDF